MKKILTLFLTLLLLAGWFVVKNTTKKDTLQSPSIISSPSSAPKTFKFDSNTDLKEELDKVDPQILESDFDT